jgi:selenide,water dikinase
MNNIPVVKDLILVGGGHSHVCVLKKFGMNPEPGVRLTLISDVTMTPYSGMLPGYIAGHYTEEECHIDLVPLAKFAKARFILARANGINREERFVHLEGRPSMKYDVLSIDIGISPGMKLKSMQWEKSSLNVTPVKPISQFSAKWDQLVPRVLKWREQQQENQENNCKRPMSITVVGGGAGGVELLLGIHHRLCKLLNNLGEEQPNQVFQMSVVTRGETVLSSHPARVQRIFRRVLRERGIRVHYDSEVVDVVGKMRGSSSRGGGDSGGILVTINNEKIEFDECVWCTSAATQPWLKETGLDLDSNGFISVGDDLRSTNTDNIFACGDVATMINHPRPKAGVFAVRQGPPLAINVRHHLLGEALEPYVPQTNFLGLISTGNKYAIMSRGGFMSCCALEGEYLWKWKDYIDRTWMAGYSTELPDMTKVMEKKAIDDANLVKVAKAVGDSALHTLSHVAMRCGGCGSKVGAHVLSRVMKRLAGNIPTRPEVLIGLDAPDDAAVVQGVGEEYATVHTVDFFRSFIEDPFIFGKIAANHALSDCHAMCADARTALAIATVPFAVEEKVEGMLYQMMAGACETLKESNCALVGGHTAEAAELSLGFAVNGVAKASHVLRKGGMKKGEVIIITKAVGTGASIALFSVFFCFLICFTCFTNNSLIIYHSSKTLLLLLLLLL